jgi:integrase
MRGHIVKRYENSWYVVVDVGRDENGRRKQKWHSGYKRRKDAEAALGQILEQLRQGTYTAPSNLTLARFCIEEWLPAVRPSLRPSTYESYAGNLQKHILPTLGARKLQQITPTGLTVLYGELMAGTAASVEGRERRPLSARTVAYIHGITRRALAEAVDWNRLIRNPADSAKPPKASSAPRMKTWTAEQLRAFLDHVAEDRLFAAWRLAATTGMRRGEVLGLTWNALDLDAATASIRATLVPGPGYAPRGSTPKTDKGRRSVALDPETVAALRAHRRRQSEERLRLGPDYDDIGLVFCREDGTPLRPRSFSRTFDNHVRQAELPRIRLHDLRHTHATLALAAGVHPKVVQERLGHASINITLDTYSHAIPAMQADAATQVATLIDAGR